ncbi:MAG: S8 family peptidase, partial [Bacteroidetes bacterium]|nr:S8 family peptidase [Bacteroidota bacterium]
PLWAGFIALVNQQSMQYVANGATPVGFINPSIYAIGKNGSMYASDVHDVATGNNEWSGSPNKFSAVSGYDICTGWGTPKGQALINALVPLFATISGPTELSVGQRGTWTVTAGGGTGNYTYAWYYRSSNTGGQWSGPVSSSTSYSRVMGNTDGFLTLEVYVTSNWEQVLVRYGVDCANCTGSGGPQIANQDMTQSNAPLSDLPKEILLGDNFPNPFNPTTEISFALPKDTYVKLIVYDILGREVARLVDGQMGAGYHTISWDASRVSSGIYIYRFSAGNFVQVKKMVLTK